MAKNGVQLSGSSTANRHNIEIVATETSYSISNNTSTVSLIARLVHTFGTPGSWGSNGSWSLAVVGQGASASGNASYDFRNNVLGWKDQGSTSITVDHNSDGSGSVNVQASFSSSHLGSGTATVVVPLTTIPRASTATFSAGTLTAGSAVTINTNRASTAFTHNIVWYFGSQSGTVVNGAGASYAWTPPLSMLTQIPSATSGSGHIRVHTMQGSTYVGTRDTPFTLQAPSSAVPTISSLSVSDTNPTVVSVVGLFVQNLSTLKATVNASGTYGSTISSRTFKMGSVTVSSGGSIPITASGTIGLTASVKDSRGRSGSWSGNISALAYAQPRFTTVLVRRSTSGGTVTDSGTSLRIDLNAAVSSLMNGTQRNSMQIKVFTRPKGGSVWTTRNTINHTAMSYNSNFVISGGANYPVDDSFDVRVDVIDKFNTSSAQSVVATAAIFMHWSKTGVGFGKYHEQGAVDVQGNVHIAGNLYPTGSIASGSVPNARLTELSAGLTIGSSPPAISDADEASTAGFYILGPTATGMPFSSDWNLEVSGNVTRQTQIARRSWNVDKVFKRWRSGSPNAWGSWKEIGDERATPTLTAAGIGSHAVVASINTVTTTITFPSGLFSAAPRVAITNSNNIRVQQTITAISSTSMTVTSVNWTDVASTTGTFHWVATQIL